MSKFKKNTDVRLESLVFDVSASDIVQEAKSNINPRRKPRRKLLKPSTVIAVIVVVFSLSMSAFAMQGYNEAAQNVARDYFFSNIDKNVVIDETFNTVDSEEFYLRHISYGDMATIDRAAEKYGAKLYLEGLQSDNIYTQYFCINKLVEFFGSEKDRLKAVEAIYPFTSSAIPQLSEAAEFAMAVLEKNYNHKWIYPLSDGSLIFSTFNNYSAYGSYPIVWRVKDNGIEKYTELSEPMKYIKSIEVSPSENKTVVLACSNKSDFMFVIDFNDGTVGPEIVSTARSQTANSMGYENNTRLDFENYSGVESYKWIDDNTIELEISMPFRDMEIVEKRKVIYKIDEKTLLAG